METKLPELLLSVAALKMCQEIVTSHRCVCSASDMLRNPEMSASVWPTKRPNNKERIPLPRRRENTGQKKKGQTSFYLQKYQQYEVKSCSNF